MALTASQVRRARDISRIDALLLLQQGMISSLSDEFGVFVDDYGADPLGNSDSTQAIAAAYVAMVNKSSGRGGSLIFKEGSQYKWSSLSFGLAPLRMLAQGCTFNQTAGALDNMINTNTNFVLVGDSQQITRFNPIATRKALNFAPIGEVGWQPSGDGQGCILVDNVGIYGGTTAVDTTGIGDSPPDFVAEGLIRFSNMLFDGQSARSMILDQSVYYSYVDHSQFNLCTGGDIFVSGDTETRLSGNIHKPGTGYPNALELAGCGSQVTVEESQFYSSEGDNTSPDIQIYATSSSADGIAEIKHNKFGDERDFNLSANRTKILGYNSANPYNNCGWTSIHHNDFYAAGGLDILSIVGNGVTATVTVKLVGGATSTGLVPGNKVYILGSYAGFCVGPWVVTAAAANTFQFASTVNHTILNLGFVFAWNPAGIVMKSPCDRWRIHDNFVNGYRFFTDDTQMSLAVDLRDQGGRCIVRDNRMVGPIGLGLSEAKEGGRQLDTLIPEPGSELYPATGKVEYTEFPQIQNRASPSNNVVGTEGPIVITTGVADPFGGDTAVNISRNDPASFVQMFSSSVLYTFQCGAVFDVDAGTADPLPDTSDRKAIVQFWAQQDASGCDTGVVALGDDANNVIQFWAVTLTPHWKQYKFSFAWVGNFTAGAINAYMCPGGLNACVAGMNFCDFQVCDAPGSSFVATTSGPFVANKTFGLSLDRILAPKAGLAGLTPETGVLILGLAEGLTPFDVTAAGPFTLTAEQAQSNFFFFGGTPGAGRIVLIPETYGNRQISVFNDTDQTISVYPNPTSIGAGVSIAAGTGDDIMYNAALGNYYSLG